eukprot:gene26807-35496_t
MTLSQPQQSMTSNNSSSNSIVNGMLGSKAISKKRRVSFQSDEHDNDRGDGDRTYAVSAPKRERAGRSLTPRKKSGQSPGAARSLSQSMDPATADSFGSIEGATLFHLCDPHFTKRRSVRESFSRLSAGTLQQISSTRLQGPRSGSRPATDSLAYQWEKAAADKARHRESGPRVEIVDGKIVLKESSLLAGAGAGAVGAGAGAGAG